jgi:hypothetical protein
VDVSAWPHGEEDGEVGHGVLLRALSRTKRNAPQPGTDDVRGR